MCRDLMGQFSTQLYQNIHQMKKYNWGYYELMNMTPIELNVFKFMILQDKKK